MLYKWKQIFVDEACYWNFPKKEEEGIATPDETSNSRWDQQLQMRPNSYLDLWIFLQKFGQKYLLHVVKNTWPHPLSYFIKFITLNTMPGQSFMKLIVKEDIVIDED